MQKFIMLFVLLISAVTFSQVSPTIVNNTVQAVTTVSATTTHPDEIKLENTLIINSGVTFTINGNLSVQGGNSPIKKVVLMGNNKLIINGNINSQVRFEMNGDCCIYATGVINAGSGEITTTGTGNYISAGSNINGFNTLPSTVCASANVTNPCAYPSTLPCGNQCSNNPNDIATWDGTNWKDNGNNNTSITSTKKAIINGNYSGASFTCCSLTVNNTKTLTVNGGVIIRVVNNIINNGTIDVLNNGSIVQDNALE